jgi:WD40 repeat protein
MDYCLRVWDVDNGVCIRMLQNQTTHFSQCIFSCHGNVIISGCDCGKLLLFDTFTGVRIKTIGGHRATITGMALVPGSDGVLVTGSSDGTVRVWEVGGRTPTEGPSTLVRLGSRGDAVGWEGSP